MTLDLLSSEELSFYSVTVVSLALQLEVVFSLLDHQNNDILQTISDKGPQCALISRKLFALL